MVSAQPVYNFDFGNQNLTEDILNEKDRKQLFRKTIVFEGVIFLKNVAMYKNFLFFATDEDVQCVMDTNTLNVFVFNRMEMPYAVLLSLSGWYVLDLCYSGQYGKLAFDA